VFSRKGYEVIGIDIAPPLIDFARKQFAEEGLSGAFITGDMRELDYEGVILSGTFGFFSNEENLALLCSIRPIVQSMR